MRELFVYYRVRADDASVAQALVAQFQQRLRALHPALTARLLQRPDAIDGVQTWMETYATDAALAPGGVGVELQAAIEAQAGVLLPLLAGPRHTEVFVSPRNISMCAMPASSNTAPAGAKPARA